MDTISRENNSMLPVGGIIVGVIALLLGGYAAITLSKVNKTLTEQEAKLAKIDLVEATANTAASTANTAASSAEKGAKEYQGLRTSTQEAFNQVGAELSRLAGALVKIEEAAKQKAAPGKKGDHGPVVAGPGEYVVKPGDGGAKIAKANGVSVKDLEAVNPGVNWNKLAIGQKIKLPKK